MTVFYKPTFSGGGGNHRRMDPRRMMTKEDLGLDLLRQYDPLLLAVGIKAPPLTRGQVASMRTKGDHVSEARREKIRDANYLSRTVAGKSSRQEVRHILAALRRLGEVRR